MEAGNLVHRATHVLQKDRATPDQQKDRAAVQGRRKDRIIQIPNVRLQDRKIQTVRVIPAQGQTLRVPEIPIRNVRRQDREIHRRAHQGKKVHRLRVPLDKKVLLQAPVLQDLQVRHPRVQVRQDKKVHPRQVVLHQDRQTLLRVRVLQAPSVLLRQDQVLRVQAEGLQGHLRVRAVLRAVEDQDNCNLHPKFSYFCEK